MQPVVITLTNAEAHDLSKQLIMKGQETQKSIDYWKKQKAEGKKSVIAKLKEQLVTINSICSKTLVAIVNSEKPLERDWFESCHDSKERGY